MAGVLHRRHQGILRLRTGLRTCPTSLLRRCDEAKSTPRGSAKRSGLRSLQAPHDPHLMACRCTKQRPSAASPLHSSSAKRPWIRCAMGEPGCGALGANKTRGPGHQAHPALLRRSQPPRNTAPASPAAVPRPGRPAPHAPHCLPAPRAHCAAPARARRARPPGPGPLRHSGDDAVPSSWAHRGAQTRGFALGLALGGRLSELPGSSSIQAVRKANQPSACGVDRVRGHRITGPWQPAAAVDLPGHGWRSSLSRWARHCFKAREDLPLLAIQQKAGHLFSRRACHTARSYRLLWTGLSKLCMLAGKIVPPVATVTQKLITAVQQLISPVAFEACSMFGIPCFGEDLRTLLLGDQFLDFRQALQKCLLVAFDFRQLRCICRPEISFSNVDRHPERKQ